MKFNQIHPAGTLAIWFGLAATSQAQLTLNYNFTPNLTVTDNGQVSSVQTLSGLSDLTSITDVKVNLNLTSANAADPMYLGDLYSSLTLGTSSESQRIAVLLNRAGRSNTDAFGSGLSSLNVTLDNSASTNVYTTTSSSGTYQADGRLSVNPNGAGGAFASGSNGLSALNGAVPTSQRVSLLVADYSQGGTATLSSWGLSVTGTISSSGTFTPGANASFGDSGSGATNTVGATIDNSGASGGALQFNLAGTTTLTGGVTGSAGLTKSGEGTLVISAASTYTGATTISAGTLKLDGQGSLANSTSIIVGNAGSSGAVLDVSSKNGGLTVVNSQTLGGIGSVSGEVHINSGAVLSPGNSPGILTTGATSLASGSIFNWELGSNVKHDGVGSDGTRGSDYDGLNASSLSVASGAIFRVVLTGSAALSDGFWNQNETWNNIFNVSGTTTEAISSHLFDMFQVYSGGTDITSATAVNYGHFSMSGSSLTWSAVPEPSSALVGLLIGAGLLRRRR